MSKDNVLSASAGMALGIVGVSPETFNDASNVLLSINIESLMAASQVFLFGLLGGIGGILGKMLVQWVTKKIKQKNGKSEKQ